MKARLQSFSPICFILTVTSSEHVTEKNKGMRQGRHRHYHRDSNLLELINFSFLFVSRKYLTAKGIYRARDPEINLPLPLLLYRLFERTQ